jgi:hypothetical protein
MGRRRGVSLIPANGCLEELTGYVSGKLRERKGSGNRAMFSRLPKWMKLAKHRVEIVKALRRLSV